MRFDRHSLNSITIFTLFTIAACGPQAGGNETGGGGSETQGSASGTGSGGTDSSSGGTGSPTGSGTSGNPTGSSTGGVESGTSGAESDTDWMGTDTNDPGCGVDTIVYGGLDGSECPIPPEGGSWPECPGQGNGGGQLFEAQGLPSDLSLSTTGVTCTVTKNDPSDPLEYELALSCEAPFDKMTFLLQQVPRIPLEVGDEVIVHGRAKAYFPAWYMWATIHRASDLRLVLAALGDAMPCPDALGAHWQPLAVELLDSVCPEVPNVVQDHNCGSLQQLAFRVTVDGDAVTLGEHAHADVGVAARYEIHVDTAYKRPCYVACGEWSSTEYGLVAIYLDPEMP